LWRTTVVDNGACKKRTALDNGVRGTLRILQPICSGDITFGDSESFRYGNIVKSGKDRQSAAKPTQFLRGMFTDLQWLGGELTLREIFINV